jgi:hypothetical protein
MSYLRHLLTEQDILFGNCNGGLNKIINSDPDKMFKFHLGERSKKGKQNEVVSLDGDGKLLKSILPDKIENQNTEVYYRLRDLSLEDSNL